MESMATACFASDDMKCGLEIDVSVVLFECLVVKGMEEG